MSDAVNVGDFVNQVVRASLRQVVEEGLYCTECPLYSEDCKNTCNQFKELKCEAEPSTSSLGCIPSELL